jgi:ABC-type lipoprotein release transport system permease subunit
VEAIVAETLVWSDPPKVTRRRKPSTLYITKLESLRSKPGVFAKISSFTSDQGAHNARYRLTSGQVVGVEPSEFEFTARTNKDATGSTLWGRFIG